MKKLISILLIALLLSSLFCTTTFASENSYRDEFINALVENESDWYYDGGNRSFAISGITFIDLNFDGKLELIMQLGGGSMLNCDAEAFYYNDGTIWQAGGSSDSSSGKTDDYGFFQNFLQGYYNTDAKQYIMLGSSKFRNGITNGWEGNFVLDFDTQDISVNYYSSVNSVNENKTYYAGANRYMDLDGIEEISEEEYNQIEEVMMENLVDINMETVMISCEDWNGFSKEEKIEALKNAYDGFTYDKYTEDETEEIIEYQEEEQTPVYGDNSNQVANNTPIKTGNSNTVVFVLVSLVFVVAIVIVFRKERE